jgi:hypothetical protein
VKPALRAGAAGVVLVVALGAGFVSYRAAREEFVALETCDALTRGDVEAALARSTGTVPAGTTGRAVATCRCRALLASDRAEECTALLAGVLADPAARGWLPPADLSAHWIAAQRNAGNTREAAEFARRAGAAYPDDAALFGLELATRASVEEEAPLLRELAERIPARGEAAARMRVALAQRHLRAGNGRAALEALGASPPEDTGPALGPWFDSQAVASAFADDLDGVRRAFASWSAAGGDPVELRARYALALSISGLADPEREPIALLRAALDETRGRAGDGLRQAVAVRLVLTLVNADRLDEALAVYDAEQALLATSQLSRAELTRAARLAQLDSAAPAERRGALAFQIAGAQPGDTLWLSAEPDAEPDSGFEALKVPANGQLETLRAEGSAPQRWVLRDARGGLRGSGTLSPVAGTRIETRIEAANAEPPAPPHARTRAAADGRRRLALLLLDCADWRIAEYLRARGDLPLFDALLREGHRAVLDSDPPLTAAALEALVWPERESGVSLAGVVHQMGVELAGLESVGRNPFAALSWVLPESADLFTTLGAGPHSAANLLLAHGGIRAGRHGEVHGPDGAQRRIPIGRAERDLDAEERARFPELAQVENARDAHLVHAIAAELDVALELVQKREVDFFALRVEPLDILTHAHFAEAVADGQDDGRGLLFSVYRYLDMRLAPIDAALDADDVLIVMSDHGILTAMEHSRDAIFVAAGTGVPVGRAPGRPALRGVARASADLLGVATTWPDTGVAPFAATGPALATRALPSDPPARP